MDFEKDFFSYWIDKTLHKYKRNKAGFSAWCKDRGATETNDKYFKLWLECYDLNAKIGVK